MLTVGISLIFVGSIVILLRAKIARKAVDFQNKTFGFHFGKGDVKANTYVGFFIGVLTIILGILNILNIIDAK